MVSFTVLWWKLTPKEIEWPKDKEIENVEEYNY
jgi:hypothetical protein